MAVIQFFEKPEVGKTTVVVDDRLEVKPDNSGNVKFTRTDDGLKGEVTLPTEKTVIKTIAIENGKLKVTNTDGLDELIELPAQAVDVKLKGAELTEDNKLKLTLSDDSVIEADLAKFVDAPKSATEYWTEIKALPDFKDTVIELLKSPEAKAALLEVLKGEEVQNLAGDTKGYLLAK